MLTDTQQVNLIPWILRFYSARLITRQRLPVCLSVVDLKLPCFSKRVAILLVFFHSKTSVSTTDTSKAPLHLMELCSYTSCVLMCLSSLFVRSMKSLKIKNVSHLNLQWWTSSLSSDNEAIRQMLSVSSWHIGCRPNPLLFRETNFKKICYGKTIHEIRHVILSLNWHSWQHWYE